MERENCVRIKGDVSPASLRPKCRISGRAPYFADGLDVLLSVTRADNNAVLGKSDEGGYYRTYGSDAEGEKGYLKETYGKGDQGYKTLDTFHKQGGDKYEFETQTSYGKGHGGDENKREEKKDGDHEGAGDTSFKFRP